MNEFDIEAFAQNVVGNYRCRIGVDAVSVAQHMGIPFSIDSSLIRIQTIAQYDRVNKTIKAISPSCEIEILHEIGHYLSDSLKIECHSMHEYECIAELFAVCTARYFGVPFSRSRHTRYLVENRISKYDLIERIESMFSVVRRYYVKRFGEIGGI